MLDTCILKLATFPSAFNPAALIAEMGIRRHFELWASPAMLEEYSYVLSEDEEFLAHIFASVHVCYPLTELSVIRHEPDNRFLECAFAVGADYIITVNVARGHFDKARYEETRVVSPTEVGSFKAMLPQQFSEIVPIDSLRAATA